MKRLLAALMIAAFCGFFSAQSSGQQLMCRGEDPAESLERDYGERLFAQSITSGGFLMSIFANEETGTYTIVLVPPDQEVFCVGGDGRKFMLVERKKRRGHVD